MCIEYRCQHESVTDSKHLLLDFSQIYYMYWLQVNMKTKIWGSVRILQSASATWCLSLLIICRLTFDLDPLHPLSSCNSNTVSKFLNESNFTSYNLTWWPLILVSEGSLKTLWPKFMTWFQMDSNFSKISPNVKTFLTNHRGQQMKKPSLCLCLFPAKVDKPIALFKKLRKNKDWKRERLRQIKKTKQTKQNSNKTKQNKNKNKSKKLHNINHHFYCQNS